MLSLFFLYLCAMSKIIFLEETDSTNTYLQKMIAAGDDLPNATTLWVHSQSAGRGQRGNSWESSPGKNLTFSMLMYPGQVDVSRQFVVSEAVAVAIAEVLRYSMPGHDISVKWPNDIYAGNKKIAGILIENSLSDRRIARTVAGIGVNVNQQLFLSDAPNPVSMRQLLGTDTPLEPLLLRFVEAVEENFRNLDSPRLHERYMAMLWRGNGFHPYADAADGSCFNARIAAVEPSGHIVLEKDNGTECRFAFKEVVALL